MPLMTDIRNNLTTLFAVLAVLFIVLIVFDWGMDLSGRRGRNVFGGGDLVGTVNGTKINYKEFSEQLRQQTENYRTQSGADPDDDTERFLRDQVWNTFVQQSIMDDQINRLGIQVTDDEIRNIVFSSNPPEFLVKNFRDSTGKFNRAAYDRAIADPQNRKAWVQVETVLREQRKQEKLQSLLFSSVRVTDDEVKKKFIDQNTSMEIEYLQFDPNRFFPDSAISVSDDDVRKHYNANQEELKIRAARKIKSVLFSLVPSHEDSLAVQQEINRVYSQAKSGMDFLELAKTYSESPAKGDFYKHGELSRPQETVIFAGKKGEIVGPVMDFDGAHLFKILDERKGKNDYVRASHILLTAVSGADSTKKIQKAQNLLKQVRSGANFAELAKLNSEDFGNAVSGGDLGWNAREGWVKQFSDAAFRAKVGEVVGPVRTQFGWHLIKVTGRDNRELKLSSILLKLKSSSQTNDATHKQAEEFSVLAKSEGFEKAAEFSKYEVRESPEFVRTGTIPGIGLSESVMNFAFSNSVGKISEPIGIRGGVVVVKVSEIRDEGVQPLDNVKNIVRSMFLRVKKMEKLKPIVDEFSKTLQPNTDLVAAAKSRPEIIAQKTTPFKPTDAVPNLGQDMAITGVALSLTAGEISKPFEGLRGYYIIRLASKSALDSTKFANARKTLRDQLLQEKKNLVLNQWFTNLRDNATIEDHRDKFFR
jgi:parvulin-like peptidyl-prolyl isomerase